MALREQQCVILACDGCGETFNHDYTPHANVGYGGDLRDEAEAYDWTNHEESDWCSACQLGAHAFVASDDPFVCARCRTEHEGDVPEEGSDGC